MIEGSELVYLQRVGATSRTFYVRSVVAQITDQQGLAAKIQNWDIRRYKAIIGGFELYLVNEG